MYKRQTWKKEAFTAPRHALSAKTARQNKTDANPFFPHVLLLVTATIAVTSPGRAYNE